VQLKGKGSASGGLEPLHLFVAAPSQQQLDTARGLADDLVTTVKAQYDEHVRLVFALEFCQ